jgi:hypothetical protein
MAFEPVGRTSAFLKRIGLLDDRAEASIQKQAADVIAQAVQELEEVEPPGADILFDYIYASERPWTLTRGAKSCADHRVPPESYRADFAAVLRSPFRLFPRMRRRYGAGANVPGRFLFLSGRIGIGHDGRIVGANVDEQNSARIHEPRHIAVGAGVSLQTRSRSPRPRPAGSNGAPTAAPT